MNGSNTVRVIAGIVLALVVIGIGVGAYQLGLQAGAVQSATDAAPAVVPPYYYGWHPVGFFGFGFFGFLGTVLFLILIFALIRAIVFGGRGRGSGGPGRWGGYDRGWRGGPWESRARETFEDWHRESHEGRSPSTGGPTGGSTVRPTPGMPAGDNPNRA